MNTDYLAFEGVDGSGKTSYIEALSSHLEKKSINFKINSKNKKLIIDTGLW